MENVVDSINGLTEYKYILADYNGKALYDTNKINIDYLVPSVSVSYLWNKIFEYYGFTYSGSVFDTFAFQNLYMTFPKGTAEQNLVPVTYYNNSSFIVYPDGFSLTLPITHNSPSPTEGVFINSNISYVLPNDGTYIFNQNLLFNVFLEDPQGNIIAATEYIIFITINNNPNNSFTLQSGVDKYLTLNEGDIITFNIQAFGQGVNISSADVVSGSINIDFLQGQIIDFNETFIDFKTKDFLNEVLTRFGLTPYKDKYTNNYRFLTLYELLQNTDVVDWSSKFHEQTNESYTYGSYAQKNDLTYKYNDAESEYNNGSILVDNVNLPDNKSVINSRIYSPEKEKTNVLPKETNVYKLWDKEVKDDGTVTYKALDKRFYFMRADNYIFDSAVTIGSEKLQNQTTIGQADFESFFKLDFNNIIADFYLPIYQILNKARLCELSIFLNDNDIVNIDFSKLYWIEQLNSYFILNKISNYTSKGITKCEMIKVDYV